MKQVLCFVVSLIPSVWSFLGPLVEHGRDPDIYRNVSQMISLKGYPVDNHFVTTNDGYILSVQHIIAGRGSNFGFLGGKKAVLLVHGLFGSAVNFVFDFPDQSLGFILADNGYDVWLANIRGTIYSRRHTKYNDFNSRFWDYSLDEMAAYDLPALIDYVLKFTGRRTLSYVGHSQGTMAAFALLSQSPEYNKKINLFIALAPAAYLGNIPMSIDRVFFNVFYHNGPNLRPRVINGNSPLHFTIKELFCDKYVAFICRSVFLEVFGDDPHINKTRIPVYAGHFPDSTSSKNLVHLGQLVAESRFRKFNYGLIGNVVRYGQPTPPDYDLTKITAPVALISSANDILSDPVDVDILRRNVRSLVADYVVPDNKFTHVDFVVAMQAKPLLYDFALGLLQNIRD